MVSNTFQTMAQPASCFDMPIYGSAFGMARDLARGTTLCVTGETAVRDRRVAGAQSLVKGAFPGTSAWRPPIC